MKTTIYIHGALGRMGQSIQKAIAENPAFALSPHPDLSDVIIDVSSPDALEALLETCLTLKKPLAIGTTGHTEYQQTLIQEASRHIPLLHTPNFSLGMALLLHLTTTAAAHLDPHLGPNYHTLITEEHHTSKKDAPSGSALILAKAIGTNIPIESLRKDATIGIHTATFTFGDEKIELTHQALSRTPFARGALLAALFLKNNPPGYYTLCHLLK